MLKSQDPFFHVPGWAFSDHWSRCLPPDSPSNCFPALVEKRTSSLAMSGRTVLPQPHPHPKRNQSHGSPGSSQAPAGSVYRFRWRRESNDPKTHGGLRTRRKDLLADRKDQAKITDVHCACFLKLLVHWFQFWGSQGQLLSSYSRNFSVSAFAAKFIIDNISSIPHYIIAVTPILEGKWIDFDISF